MALDRRGFIKIIGSSAVIVAAGAGGFALTREPKAALAPWERAGKIAGDVRHKALSWAILAPNPHNRQPWVVDLAKPDEADLYCDLDRRLPETDPFDRQITIGLGCFLETLRIAASRYGYEAAVTAFPEGGDQENPAGRLDRRPVAHIRFTPAREVREDPLFRQVSARRSVKEPYETDRAIAPAPLGAIAGAGGPGASTSIDGDLVAKLRSLTWDAFEIEVRTPRTYMESVNLMRIGKTEIEASPDGIDLGGPMFEMLNKAGLLTRETVADPKSSAFQQGLDSYRPIMATAMGYLWISTPGNSRTDQLDAGASYIRANLKATELGVAMHPVSQALQEYAEMENIYAKLHAMLDVSAPSRIQMLARLGYGPQVSPSPRWPAESRISSG